jgi:hypothetical protein
LERDELKREKALPHYTTAEQLVESTDQSPVSALFKIPNSLLNKCYEASKSILNERANASKMNSVHQEHTGELKCIAFYNHCVELNEFSMAALENHIRAQSD